MAKRPNERIGEWIAREHSHLGLGAGFWNGAEQYQDELTDQIEKRVQIEKTLRKIWPEKFPQKIRIVSAAIHRLEEQDEGERAAQLAKILKDHLKAKSYVLPHDDDSNWELPAFVALERAFILCQSTDGKDSAGEDRLCIASPDPNFLSLSALFKELPPEIRNRLETSRIPLQPTPRVLCPDFHFWNSVLKRRFDFLLWRAAVAWRRERKAGQRVTNLQQVAERNKELAGALSQLVDHVNATLDGGSSREFQRAIAQTLWSLRAEGGYGDVRELYWSGIKYLWGNPTMVHAFVRNPGQDDAGGSSFPQDGEGHVKLAICPLPPLWSLVKDLIENEKEPGKYSAKICEQHLYQWNTADEDLARAVAMRIAGRRVVITGNSVLISRALEIGRTKGTPPASIGMLRMDGPKLNPPPGVEDLGSYKDFMGRLPKMTEEERPELVYAGCAARCHTSSAEQGSRLGYFCREGTKELVEKCNEVYDETVVHVAAAADKLCNATKNSLCEICQKRWANRFSPLNLTRWVYFPPTDLK